MWTSGPVTRPESIWKAMSLPTVSVPSKTASAPIQMMAMNMSFSIRPERVLAVMEICATRK